MRSLSATVGWLLVAMLALVWSAAVKAQATLPRGTIEVINRSRSFMNVRDSGSGTCPLYYITAASKLSKILEMFIVRTYRPKYVQGRAGNRILVGEDLVQIRAKEGARFFVTGIPTTNFAVDQQTVLDGRWRVDGTASAVVTKSTAIQTTIVSTMGREMVQHQSKVRAETRDEKEINDVVRRYRECSLRVRLRRSGQHDSPWLPARR